MSEKIIFIYGNEDLIVKKQAQKVFDEMLLDDSSDFSSEILDGAVQNVSELEDLIKNFKTACQSIPLLGDKKSIWLKNVNFLGDSKTSKAQSAKDLIDSLIEFLKQVDLEKINILISASPVDRKTRGVKGLSSISDFTDLKAGSSPEETFADLSHYAKELGLSFEEGALESLFERVNGSYRVMIEEINKMSSYLEDKQKIITEQLVFDLVPHFGEGNFFEVTELFYSNDLQKCFNFLERYFFTHQDARAILTSLQNKNRLLIQAKVLLESGQISSNARVVSSNDLQRIRTKYLSFFGDQNEKSSANFLTQNPWYLANKILPQAKVIPLKKLIEFQTNFSEAFLEIINRPKEQLSVMKELAIKCI